MAWLNRRQAITWTNDDRVQWRIYAALGGEPQHRMDQQDDAQWVLPIVKYSNSIVSVKQPYDWYICMWKIKMPSQLLNTKWEWNRQRRLIQNHDWSQHSAIQSDAINTMNTKYIPLKLFSSSLSPNYPCACLIHFHSDLSLIKILKLISGSVSTCTKMEQSCFSRLMERMIGHFDYQVRWIALYCFQLSISMDNIWDVIFYCMLPELKYSIIPLRVYDSPYPFNSYAPSAAYMLQWTRSLVQVMASRLFGAITWSNADLLSIGPLGQNTKHFIHEKAFENVCEKVDHFVQGEMSWYQSLINLTNSLAKKCKHNLLFQVSTCMLWTNSQIYSAHGHVLLPIFSYDTMEPKLPTW